MQRHSQTPRRGDASRRVEAMFPQIANPRNDFARVRAALPATVAGISILSHNGIAAAVVSRVVHMRKTGGRGVTARRVVSPRLASPTSAQTTL